MGLKNFKSFRMSLGDKKKKKKEREWDWDWDRETRTGREWRKKKNDKT